MTPLPHLPDKVMWAMRNALTDLIEGHAGLPGNPYDQTADFKSLPEPLKLASHQLSQALFIFRGGGPQEKNSNPEGGPQS